MEIHRIEICNLNSLKGEFTIDFMSGRLRDQDIFAITGPTGSGKSTILDAITLALYNRIPRLDGKSGTSDPDSMDPYKRLKPEDTENALTRGTKDGYARVYFEASGKTYMGEWICQRKRLNFSGTHSLYSIEQESGSEKKTLLASRNLIGEFDSNNKPRAGTASEKVVELIGLGYDQFCKACILAQNSFANFLKADDHEKTDILEKITGTDIYGRIGAVIRDGYETAAKARDGLKSEVGGMGVNLIRDPQELARLQSEEESLATRRAELEERITRIGNGLDWWGQLDKLQKDLEETREADDNARTRIQKITSDRQRLDRHDSLGSGIKLLDAESQARVNLSNAEENLNAAEGRLKKNREDIEENGRNKEGAESDLAAKKAALEGLSAIKPIKDNLSFIGSEYNLLHKSVGKLREAVVKIRPESADEGEAALFGTARRLTAGLDPDLTRDGILSRLERLRREIAVSKDAGTLSNCLEQIAELDSEDRQDSDTITSQSPLQEELGKDIAALHDRILSMQNKDLSVKRGLLEEGKPCELCGALHHPFATEEVFNEEIRGLQDILDVKKADKEKVDGLIDRARGDISTRKGKKSILATTISNLKEQITGDSERFGSIFSSYTLEAQIRALKEKSAGLGQLETEKTEAEGRLSLVEIRDLYSECAEHISQLGRYLPAGWYEKRLADEKGYADSLKEDIRSYDNAKKALDTAEQQVRAIIQNIKTLTEQTPGLESDRKRLEGFRDTRKTELEAGHRELSEWIRTFNSAADNPVSEEEIRAQKEDPTDWKKLRDDIQTVLDEGIRCDTLLGEAQKKIEGHLADGNRPSEGREELEGLKNAAVSELKSDGDGVELRLANVMKRLQDHDQAEKNIAGMADRISEAERTVSLWEKFYRMLGKSAKGDREAKEFRMVAQNYTLGLLLSYANRELAKFTKRYQLRKQNDSTLEIMVLDGELGERYASSLSGGETFMVSLALALGLSSISSGSVTIRNLFIDEGFGSLDSDTQATVVNALNQLRMQNKRIGVISHTAALLGDDSIYKIAVRKVDDQFSVIDID